MDVFTPQVGDLVLDTHSRQVGEYRGTVGGEVYLRPPGGGIEWTTDPENVRPPSPDLEYANPAGAPKGSIPPTSE